MKLRIIVDIPRNDREILKNFLIGLERLRSTTDIQLEDVHDDLGGEYLHLFGPSEREHECP